MRKAGFSALVGKPAFMLPLHNTFRNLVFISFPLIIFESCSHRPEGNLAIIKTLDESLVNSNKLLAASTSDYLISLNAKLSDIGTRERAKIWFQKAQNVESLSNQVNDYIEKIKAELSEKTGSNKLAVDKFLNQNKDRIYDSLINYEKKVLAVDDRIYRQFSKSLVVVSTSFDTPGKNGSDLFNTFFDNSNNYLAQAMLTKLQNNIKVIENKVIMFCYEQVGSTGGSCTFISAITGINSSIVQPGEQIEIFSGVGSFDSRPKAEVFVYGKPVPVNENAIAVLKFKAEKKPGKYYVPVKINYTDQDGKPVTIEKEIEYTVANIQKQ